MRFIVQEIFRDKQQPHSGVTYTDLLDTLPLKSRETLDKSHLLFKKVSFSQKSPKKSEGSSSSI